MTGLRLCLWFERDAEATVRRYCDLLPDSHFDRIDTMPADTPSGPEGAVRLIQFTLLGQPAWAMQAAGRPDGFGNALSLVVTCDTQAEIDRIWEGLLAGGGTPQACGWLRDAQGVAWQVIPRLLGEHMADPDKARARRVTEAMLGMVKIDVAALEAAARG